MTGLTPTTGDSPPATRNTSSASLYVQHPGSVSLGPGVILGNNSETPKQLSEGAAFIYTELRTPSAKAELIHRVVEKFGLSHPEGPAQVESALQEMIDKGFIVEIVPGAPLPPEGDLSSRRLLWEAELLLGAGEWCAAEALCAQAGRNPGFAEIAELDALCARYAGGQFDGIVERAAKLAARVTGPAAASCGALALLTAHRTGAFEQAKRIALHLERRYKSPIDLPTVPRFAALVRGQILVLETNSVGTMLRVIDELLAAGVGSPDEVTLLESLAQRYRERA